MRGTWALVASLAVACSAAPSPPGKRPGVVLAEQHGIDATAWLAPDASRARAAGAGALDVLAADVASEGDRVGAFVDAPGGACLLALTRASPGVVDLELLAFEDDGSAFAAEESPDPRVALLLCPPTPRRLYVAARIGEGAGIVALGVMAVPKGAEAAVQKAVGARGRPGDDVRADGIAGLEGKVVAHRASLGGRWEELRRVPLPLDPHAATRFSASVEAGRCLDLFVVASDEVGALEVVAEDDKGRVVALARGGGRERALLVCARLASSIGVSIRPRSSPGQVVVSMARSIVGGAAELAPATRATHLVSTDDLPAARAALDKELRAAGYGPAKGLGTGTARLGSRSSLAVDLPAGCARLDVLVGRPFAELAATLWDDKAQVLADVATGGSGVLFTCGKGGSARLDLEAVESGGPFGLELRKEKIAPPALVAHPVAASRLLARVVAGGASVDAAATAEPVTLDASTLKSVPLVVPAGGCAEVVAALDAGGAGLDLRVVDGATKEGEVTRARHVASGRLCGGAAGARGSAELRLDSGKADALVLVRVLK